MQNWNLNENDFNELINIFDGNGYEFAEQNGIFNNEDCLRKLWIYKSKEDGFIYCPRCDVRHGNPPEIDFHKVRCKKCRYFFSFKSGTYLDGTKLQPSLIFRLAFLIGDMKSDSSHFLARNSGCTQKTAWWFIEIVCRSIKETSNEKFKNKADILKNKDSYNVIKFLLKSPKTPQSLFRKFH